MTARQSRLTSFVVRTLAALAVLVGSLTIAITAASPARAADATMQLVSQSFYVKDQIEFHLAISGAPADAAIWVTVYDRLKSRAEFDSSLTGSLPSTVGIDSFP